MRSLFLSRAGAVLLVALALVISSASLALGQDIILDPSNPVVAEFPGNVSLQNNWIIQARGLLMNGPINMGGNNVTNVNAVNTDDLNVNRINGKTLAEIGGGGASVVDGGGYDNDVSPSDGGTVGTEVLMPTTFRIAEGTSVDVDSGTGIAVVFATEKIVINGTLDAKGLGARGGAWYQGSPGFCNYEDLPGYEDYEGKDGHIVGGGGSGGDGGDVSGVRYYDAGQSGAPGGGRIYSDSDIRFLSILYSDQWDPIFNLNLLGGAGGGTGGHGAHDQYDGGESGCGGGGGDGGGSVVFVAPEIIIGKNAIIDIRGNQGQVGMDARCWEDDDPDDKQAGGGGGGGGSGGDLITVSNSITVKGDILLDGGPGGAGGMGCNVEPDPNNRYGEITRDCCPGEDGRDGRDGRHLHIDLS